MQEVFRILKPNGIFRIVLPDLRIQIDKYLEQAASTIDCNKAADTLIDELMMVKNSRDPHLWMYDKPSIIAKLEKIGFKKVYPCTYKQGNCVDIEILDNRPEFSLWVEAMK